MLSLADPRIGRFVSKCMVVRVATLSTGGLPHLTPLWFVRSGGDFYMNTRADSPAARDIAANGDVVLLFDNERGRSRRVLQIRGRATFSAGKQFSPGILARFTLKYYLNPGGAADIARNLRTVPARMLYYRERAGEAGAIQVTPETAELLPSLAGASTPSVSHPLE
ncbi:MAG TPA: pyridoxamine 5'-phosphate oxidase family protein [Dehalococcoidia bacterium]